MHADLMRAPGLEFHLEQAVVAPAPDQADDAVRRLAVVGDAHAGLSPRLGPALAHEVLADALGHYLGIGVDVLPRAYRGANALSEDDGAYWWILAAQDAAGRDITPGGEIAYVQAVAASKRSAWLAGAVA